MDNKKLGAGLRSKISGAGFNDYLQSVRMIVWPMIISSPAVLIWHLLYVRGFHSTASADEPIVNAILPALATIHVFIAGFVMMRETTDLRELKRAVRNQDKASFIEVAEDKIAAPLKYVLFISASLIQGWTISLNYELYWTGFASVFSIGYMLSLIWEIISDFDDPVNGVWVVKSVPPDWIHETNIKRRISDKFFELLFSKIQIAYKKFKA